MFARKFTCLHIDIFMKLKIYLPLLFTATSLIAKAQITINTGTDLTILNGTTVTSLQDVSIEPNASLTNNGTLAFHQNLNNFGTKSLAGTILAKGNQVQSIGGADSFAVSTLQLNNDAGLHLESKVAVNDALFLEKGVLYTSAAHPVYFTGKAANPNETTNGYIEGTAILNTRDIQGAYFGFLGCDVITTKGDAIGTFGVKRVTGANAITQIGDETSIAAKWDLDNNKPTTDASYDVTFSWLPVFDNGKDIQSLGLYGTTYWEKDKFVSLDERSKNSLSVNGMSDMRFYMRNGLDYFNRTLTLSGKHAQSKTLPEVKITTFPNPATDHINILVENLEDWATAGVVRITDAYGKLMNSKVYMLNGNMITINDIGSFPSGVYRLVLSRGQLVKVVNFVKQ